MTARRRVDPKLLLASLILAAGIVAVALGFRSSVTGRDEQRLPEEIESIDPIRGAAQVLHQTRVFVDLAEGHEGELVLDGIEIPTVSLDELGSVAGVTIPAPGEQISLPPVAVYEPGNATITYTPIEGGPVEQFDSGLHTATVRYWRIEDGRGAARSYTWNFYVV